MRRLCEEIDERVDAFLTRPIEGEWPCLWIDATYLKVREGWRIVSAAVIYSAAPWLMRARNQRVVSAFFATAFAQPDHTAAKAR